MKKNIFYVQILGLASLVFFGILFLLNPGSAQPSASALLNEFSVEDGWVEIANVSESEVDLSSWNLVVTVPGVSNATTTLSGTLPPYGLLVFDGIGLSATGTLIALYHEDAPQDSITYGELSIPEVANINQIPGSGESAVILDPMVRDWEITASTSLGWFNNAVDYSCPLVASDTPPTLSSIADCLANDGIDTNLDTVINPSAMSGDSGLYFEKEGLGKVKFDGLLNFTDYAVVQSIQLLGEKLIIDAGNLRFPSDMGSAMDVPGGAGIIFYDIGGLGFSTGTRPEGVNLNIIVKDDGGEIIPMGSDIYPTIDGFYLDGNTGNLSFNVSHFTEFELNPTVIEVTPVEATTTNANLEYVFYTDVVGDITYGGSCSSNVTSSQIGNNTISFDSLPAGTYSNCVVIITDGADRSTSLSVSPFTVVVSEEVYVFEAEFDGGPEWGVNGFTDIQSAIDAVAVGGTVNVASGTYIGNVIIDKELTLVGDVGDVGDGSVGAGTDAPTVIGSAETDSSTITINASGVTVSGLIIQNDNSDYPGLIIAPDVSDVTVSNNEITSTLMGIILGATSYENLITKNKIYGNGDGGIEIGGSTSNVISYNDIYGNTYSGIILNYMDDYSYWDSTYNASSSEVGANNIVNNNIYQNGAYGINILTDIETASGLVNIRSNTIEENDDSGIYIDESVENISIENNTIKSNGQVSRSTGIAVISALNNSAYNNIIIEDKAGIGIKNYDGANDFDAVQNYWGSEFGPYEAKNLEENILGNLEGNPDSKVEGRVNYKPYYADEAMTIIKGAIISGTDPEYYLSTVYEVSTSSFNLSIPAGTMVTGYAEWDGDINPPTVTTIAVVDQPAGAGYQTEITVAYEVGAGAGPLLLDQAAKLVFTGQAGKKVGYIRAGASFVEITAFCIENSQSWADANLGAEGDCKKDDGADLVVWTKHFTKFATYTQTPVAVSGGGGGIVMASPCAEVTYDEWGACVNGMQYRNLLGQVPSGCSLTAEQQNARSKACGAADPAEVNVGAGSGSVGSYIDVNGVMNRERLMVNKANMTLTNRLLGRILLQVEEQGQAWYLEPITKAKHFMGRPLDAFNLMRKFGLGISNANLKRFQDSGVPRTFAGRIFLQVESVGEAYYVNPIDLKMHYLGRPADAFRIMRELSLGITNSDIRQITVGE